MMASLPHGTGSHDLHLDVHPSFFNIALQITCSLSDLLLRLSICRLVRFFWFLVLLVDPLVNPSFDLCAWAVKHGATHGNTSRQSGQLGDCGSQRLYCYELYQIYCKLDISPNFGVHA